MANSAEYFALISARNPGFICSKCCALSGFIYSVYNVHVVIFRYTRMLGGVGARRRRGSSPMARLTNTNVFGLDDNIAIIGDGVTRNNGAQAPAPLLPPGTQALGKRRRVAAASGPETFALAQTRLKLGDIM